MKKLLFRKLISDYLSFFILALLSSSIIVWVFQAVNFLDIMIDDGRDYLIYIYYSLLHFPKILAKLFPFVLFFSLFYVTIKYEANNELIIFWNFGIHKTELINFIIKFSILMTIIQILLTSLVVPKSQDTAKSFIRGSTVNVFENFIKPQRFNDTIKNLTIYSEKKDLNGNLINIYLKKKINEEEFQITYAKKGFFKSTNKFPYLVLFEGETISSKGNNITNLKFSKSEYPLNDVETNTTTYKKTQELSTIKIIKCMNKFYEYKEEKNFNYKEIENCSLQNLSSILKEIYKRIVIPLYIPLLMMVPYILITSSKESSKYLKIKYLTFLIGLFFIIFSETTIRFISSNYILNVLICLLPIIFTFLLYFIFYKKFDFKKAFDENLY
tara:strand:+ start:596 stop:1747 length:1152 start_codon:yes stop_codon:yes gene_type:complete